MSEVYQAWWRGEWIETSVRCNICKKGIAFPEASAAEPRTATGAASTSRRQAPIQLHR
jgi:hypothetical protein